MKSHYSMKVQTPPSSYRLGRNNCDSLISTSHIYTQLSQFCIKNALGSHSMRGLCFCFVQPTKIQSDSHLDASSEVAQRLKHIHCRRNPSATNSTICYFYQSSLSLQNFLTVIQNRVRLGSMEMLMQNRPTNSFVRFKVHVWSDQGLFD